MKSLLDSLKQRFTIKTPRHELEGIPSGLEPLFNELFAQIGPRDRRISAIMIMLALRSRNRRRTAWVYPWIEDLENHDFPFDIPSRAMIDEEIFHRKGVVDGQLDKVTKGLLEFTQPLPNLTDEFFSEHIQFLHRSALNCFSEPGRKRQLEGFLGPCYSFEDLKRLCLAAFKCCRLSATTLGFPNCSGSLIIFTVFFSFDARINGEEDFFEIENTIENLRKMQYTIPGGRQNDGMIKLHWWGKPENSPHHADIYAIDETVYDFSLPHVLAYYGDFPNSCGLVLKRLEQDPSSSCQKRMALAYFFQLV